jgi:DNA-binding protein HU-beta
MNKSDLVERISVDAHISKGQANKAVDSVIHSITGALKRGDHVTLSGFGSFTVYQRRARNGRNPQTGATLKIKSQRVAKFSSGIDLKKAVGKG